MTLRDLGEGHGGIHRINAYFYNNWADEYSHLRSGDEIVVSGLSSRLVRVDHSAGSGDHPCCLAFYTPLDDVEAEVETVAADVMGSCVDDVGVTLKIVKAAENVARGGPAGGDGQRRRDGHRERADNGRWRGADSKQGAKQGENTGWIDARSVLRFSGKTRSAPDFEAFATLRCGVRITCSGSVQEAE